MSRLIDTKISGTCSIPEDTLINEQYFLDKLYPIGSTYISSKNINPSTFWGGKWELIDKHYECFYGNSATDGVYFTPNKTNISSHACYIVRTDNCIRLRLEVVNAVTFNNDEKKLGVLNYSNIGLASLPYSYYHVPSISDTGTSAALITHIYNTGEMQVRDVVADNAGTLAAGGTIIINYTINVPINRMLDDYCNKFYWKRTS